MLTLKTRSNEKLLSQIFVVNEGELEEGIYGYNVSYTRFLPNQYKIEFTITHRRNDGHERLIRKIYEEIDKQLNTVLNPKSPNSLQ